MATDIASAISAYSAAVKRLQDTSTTDSAAPAGSSFTTMVKNFAENAVEAGKDSEKLTAAAAAGQADINQVVVAVAEAEVTLNTVVAVRDKVIEAYRTIIRMPI